MPDVYSLVRFGETRVQCLAIHGVEVRLSSLVTGTVVQDGCSGPHVTCAYKGL